MHAKNSEKVLVRKGAKESEVLENILPQQKKETTLMHATNSEKVLVTTSTKESAVLETHLPHQNRRRR